MLVVLPTLYVNLTGAISSLDKDVLEMCNLFNVDKKKTFYKVIVPGVAPQVLTATGAGISLNLKLMVAAEVLASTAKSLGGLLNYSNYNLQTANMIALVVVTVIVGLLIEKIFNVISIKVGKWQ
jgi:ABC-type nitrate/sulfonate/bicarbonate transport system permease component